MQLLGPGSLTNVVGDLPAMYSSSQAVPPRLHHIAYKFDTDDQPGSFLSSPGLEKTQTSNNLWAPGLYTCSLGWVLKCACALAKAVNTKIVPSIAVLWKVWFILLNIFFVIICYLKVRPRRSVLSVLLRLKYLARSKMVSEYTRQYTSRVLPFRRRRFRYEQWPIAPQHYWVKPWRARRAINKTVFTWFIALYR